MQEEFGEAYAAAQIARRQSFLRRIAKAFYLDNAVRYVSGPTIDFGCGAGQLLERLPAGSVGLEINRYLVTYLQGRGLDALGYNGQDDNFQLGVLSGREFQSMILSHVLEHFASPDIVLNKLAEAGRRHKIRKLVAICPGAKGYRSDPTHKTFFNLEYVKRMKLTQIQDLSLVKYDQFPIRMDILGKYYLYHELIFVWEHK